MSLATASELLGINAILRLFRRFPRSDTENSKSSLLLSFDMAGCSGLRPEMRGVPLKLPLCGGSPPHP